MSGGVRASGGVQGVGGVRGRPGVFGAVVPGVPRDAPRRGAGQRPGGPPGRPRTVCFGHPAMYPTRPPRGTKSHQKTSKGPLKEGPPGSARARNEKCDFLVLRMMVLGTPAFCSRRARKAPARPERPQKATKRLQKASKGP